MRIAPLASVGREEVNRWVIIISITVLTRLAFDFHFVPCAKKLNFLLNSQKWLKWLMSTFRIRFRFQNVPDPK